MITITSLPSGACAVKTDAASFQVFPTSPAQGTWSLLSHPEETLTEKKWISWPGEYDFSEVTLRAIGQEQGKQVSYHAVTGGIRLAFVDAPVLTWTDAELEKLGDVDVLVIAADDPKKVLALVEAVDPRVIVLFKVKDGDLPGTLKACGQSSATPVSEFKVKPGTLPQDSRQVVVLG